MLSSGEDEFDCSMLVAELRRLYTDEESFIAELLELEDRDARKFSVLVFAGAVGCVCGVNGRPTSGGRPRVCLAFSGTIPWALEKPEAGFVRDTGRRG